MKKALVLLFALLSFSLSTFAAVDLNTATKEQLMGVNGIGASKAQAIIDYRTKNGNFKSISDLDNVKGFGAKTIEKLKADITVGGATAPAAKDKKK